jgi:hypothetical protein
MKPKMTIRDQKGAAVVEFAIVLPLLVLLIAGIIEFSLLLYNKQVITNASREGAREGITNEDCSVPGVPCTEAELKVIIKPIVEAYCLNHLITFGGTKAPKEPEIKISSKTIPDREELEVIVRFDYTFLVSSLIGLGLTKELTAYTTMNMF